MYFDVNKETCDKIRDVLNSQSEKPQNIRVYIAGMG